MVGIGVDGLGRAEEIMSPFFKTRDNGKQFFVVNVVVAFGGGHAGRHIRDGMPRVIGLLLGENTSYGVVGGVTFDLERGFGIRDDEDRICGDAFFELVDGFVLFVGPFPGGLAGEFGEGLRDPCEVLNEASIEIEETKEGL